MSYIKGRMTCRVCGKEYKYCWLYADGKLKEFHLGTNMLRLTTTNKVISILLALPALVDTLLILFTTMKMVL